MRPVNEKLRADLLEAGKREFMENGFRGASLKSIAASLGVTTGAIYRYYTDKEALFDGLVREPAHELVERYRTLQQTFAGRNLEEQLQKLPEVPDKEASWMMDFLYDHFDAFKLIACCSSGTKIRALSGYPGGNRGPLRTAVGGSNGGRRLSHPASG